MLVEILFWCSTGILVLTYPVAWLVTRAVRPASPAVFRDGPESLPRVTILVAAYNEEAVIRQKLANFETLDYPSDKLDMVVVSDNSSDSTDRLVREQGGDRVRLVNYGERLGKIRILNRTVPDVEGEIVIQTDADVMIDPAAVRAFARWYSDPAIGLVCGYEVRQVPVGGDSIRTETTYRDLEVRIRILQSRFGAVMGAYGGLYSLRRSCWKTLPDNCLADDVMTPMNVLQEGYKVVMDSSARGMEITGTRLGEEFQRRIRIGTGAFQVFWWHRWLLNPLHGWKSLFFWIHKLPRWFAPHLMLLALVCNALLAGRGGIYALCFNLQLVFYFSALLGTLLGRLPFRFGLLLAPAHFCSMNLAVLVGFFRWMGGIRTSTWEPSTRR